MRPFPLRETHLHVEVSGLIISLDSVLLSSWLFATLGTSVLALFALDSAVRSQVVNNHIHVTEAQRSMHARFSSRVLRRETDNSDVWYCGSWHCGDAVVRMLAVIW